MTTEGAQQKSQPTFLRASVKNILVIQTPREKTLLESASIHLCINIGGKCHIQDREDGFNRTPLPQVNNSLTNSQPTCDSSLQESQGK